MKKYTLRFKIQYQYFVFFMVLAEIALSCSPNTESEQYDRSIFFEPTWESLAQYSAPEWFKDAKFGIFMHWGPMSVVPNNGGWYGRHMYMQYGAKWGEDYKIHRERYGHQSEFGYKDIIPLWKAKHWDPDALVKFYKKIGARYIVPVAVHHDNFDLYNSKYQPWNSVNMGPQKDIMEGWRKAALKHGLRFGVSSHNDRTWTWFSQCFGADSTGAYKGIPYDGNLTKEHGKGKWWEGYAPADLYSRPHNADEPADKEYLEKWYKRTVELIDNYQPDLIYFDGPLPCVGTKSPWKDGRPEHEKYGLELASYFYNSNQQWHNRSLEAVMTIKEWGKGSIPDPGIAVMDIEKGSVKEINENAWQGDTSIPKHWFYNGDGKVELSDTVIIHNLCDVVSKNGNLLLNVGLKPDGTLPNNERAILQDIGKWLDVNGEAIFDTRPWLIFGEGNSDTGVGTFNQNLNPYTHNDIRFTTKKGVLYAIVLGWPKSRTVNIKSITSDKKRLQKGIRSIQLLGSDEEINWERTENGLKIYLPKRKPCNYAYTFKIIQ